LQIFEAEIAKRADEIQGGHGGIEVQDEGRARGAAGAVASRKSFGLVRPEERIASVPGADMTSIQAVYVPADDFTDPAVAETFTHLDASVVLTRSMAAEGLYPAVDPLASSSLLLDPRLIGEEHYDVAEQTRTAIARYRELADVIAMLGMEELSVADRLMVHRARRLQRFLTQPFFVTEAFTGQPGCSVDLEDTIAGSRAILDGEADDWNEASLYMIGTLDQAREREEAA
jgi:F-type H+-transporting ATPase subunit beta